MNLALIGFGGVGQGLAHILASKAADLHDAHGFEARIVAVVTRSRGSLYAPNGLDIPALLEAMAAGGLSHYPDQPGLRRDFDALTIARESNADVLIEASPSNLETGQPALEVCLAAFAGGRHVVLANKGAMVCGYGQLQQAAQRAGKKLLFEATVMGGTPALRLGMKALAGCTISEVKGIINGTTNYILTQMEGGMSYGEALAEAQGLGYAEADPTADVDGWDAAGKAIILAAALFNRPVTFDDMTVQGISHLTPDHVAAAKEAGERWKLIARVTPESASVQPMRIPISHPLAGVAGATNALTLTTDLLGDVTLIGKGAGGVETGFGLLSDLMEIHRAEH
jgi:homoserine dehydrogenase